MLGRRQFLKASAATGALLLLRPTLRSGGARAEALPGGTLDPAGIEKYAARLVIPPAMPPVAQDAVDHYEIAVRQFQQQILPPSMPETVVWGYGSVAHPETFSYPAFTIEATANRPVRVKWINDLVDAQGNFLPAYLARRSHIALGQPTRRRRRAGHAPDVRHDAGSIHRSRADRRPPAWRSHGGGERWLRHRLVPSCRRRHTRGHATVGSFYDEFKSKFEDKYGETRAPGTAIFRYENDERASTLWFHDHTLGMTRLNVYAGPAGFYVVRGGVSDLPPGVLPGPARS